MNIKSYIITLTTILSLHCASFNHKPTIAGPAELKLFSAVISGDIKGVKKQIEEGANLNAFRKKDGNTALMLAAENRRYEIMNILLESGAAVDTRNQEKYTALFYAIWCDSDKHDCSDSARIVRTLISNGADINTKGSDNYTPLMAAASRGNPEIISLLLAAGAEVNAKNSLLQSPLIFALHFQNKTKPIQLLLDAGVELNTFDKKDVSPLMSTAISNKIEFTKMLLKAGADPNLKDSNGRTALTHAAYGGKEEILQELIKGGADINIITNDGETLLTDMASCPLEICKHYNKILKSLIAAGIDVNSRTTKHGETPLMAVSNGFQVRLDAIKTLISAGADVNAKDNNGDTALINTAYCYPQEMDCTTAVTAIKTLLQAGADINAKNRSGETVVDMALKNKSLNIYMMLQNKISAVSAPNTLASNSDEYRIENLLDGTTRFWCEGVDGNGVGQELTITLDQERTVSSLFIINGVAYNEHEESNSWKKRNRVKALRLSSGGKEVFIKLNDSHAMQRLTFSPLTGKKIVATIESVYHGSDASDTCLNEIAVVDEP